MVMLDELIGQLAAARASLETLKFLADCWQDALEKTHEWQALQGVRETLAEARNHAEDLAEQARVMALLRYEEGGDRHPHPAVTIKLFDVVRYDPEEARRYCVDHLPAALNLDKARFERAAKVLGLDFVTIEKEPRAQIATQLPRVVRHEAPGEREPEGGLA